MKEAESKLPIEVQTLPDSGPLAGYRPPPGVFDEMVAPDGTVRGPWRAFLRGIHRFDEVGLYQRAEQTRELLRENGVTYNVQGAPTGPDRPWELDPLPLVFSRREWEVLATAIRRRTELLSLILQDVYGPQRLLKERVLPPSLFFENPNYLLPCRDLPISGESPLLLYAGHLARRADGGWCVLADRARGPSGAGYAIENRIVLSRTLSQDFETLHVKRLAGFFGGLRDTLLGLGSGNRENPRIVLLSPGPRSSRYFEDGYLARYLGYTLVEGGDLTVRGNTVYLKTLGGLLPVDVILRRIPDEDMDPLELGPDSPLGTPGCLEAIRARKVVAANGIGSGFLETPVLSAFLSAAAKFFFGEELTLPSPPTWWCGREEDLKFVAANLEHLVIRPAFVERGTKPVHAGQLPPAARQNLLEQIRERPGRYLAQQPVDQSTAPALAGRVVRPWYVTLRVFAAATGDGYSVMPGGLSRVSEHPFQAGVSTGSGETSKDVWVLSDEPVEPVTLLRRKGSALELRRSTNDLPSRVADNLFWLGRLGERAEAFVRLLRSCVVRLTNDLEPAGLADVAKLVAAMSDEGAERPPDGDSLGDRLRREVVVRLFDGGKAGTLASTLHAFHRTASTVRDRLSVDSWRIVHQCDLRTLYPWKPDHERLGDILLVLNQLLNLLAAFGGLGAESMTRGPGWRFLDMGRRIERAVQTLGLVRRTLVEMPGESIPMLEAILEIADSSMTYRYRYLTSLQLAPLLDLVLIDETNPRAVGYQLNALYDHVAGLPREAGTALPGVEQKIVLSAQSEIRLTDVEALCDADEEGVRQSMFVFLTSLEDHLLRLSDTITHHYLAHTGPSRQLGTMAAGRKRILEGDA